MSKKILSVVFILIITLSLCGCQLAKPESEGAMQSERLVGVFVTTEYLDLIDMESYLQDNIENIVEGKNILKDTDEYKERIYATFIEKTYQNSKGEYYLTNTYEFPDLEGMPLALYQIDSEQNSYITTSADEGICDVNSKTGGNDQEISGTIWVVKDSGDITFYMNPVYQTSDGQVYLVPGSGLQVNSDGDGRASQKLNETVNITENGESSEQSFTVEVFIDFIQPDDMITIIQMNEQDSEVQRDTFLTDNLPKEFTPEDHTAYLIVQSNSGNDVKRQINQPGDTAIEVFVRLNTEICTQERIAVNWK